MTTNEWLLQCLSEECSEVAQRVSKALRFGLAEIQPGQDLTNAQRVMEELGDLIGVARILCDNQMLPGPLLDHEKWEKKEGKIKKYLDYAKEIGIVRDPNLLERDDSWVKGPVVHPDGAEPQKEAKP